MTKTALIYRNNTFWEQLSATLLDLAALVPSGGGFCKGGTVEVVQVFPEGTSEDEITAWVKNNKKMLKVLSIIHCDTTVARIVNSVVGFEPRTNKIDDARDHAIGSIISAEQLAIVYSEILRRLIEATRATRVVFVMECLSDYNPLHIPGCERKSRKASEQYFQAFCALLPVGVETSVVSIQDVVFPEEGTLLVAHHHAWAMKQVGGGIGGESHQTFRDSGRLIPPYISGLRDVASEHFDVDQVLSGDVVEATRGTLQRMIARADGGSSTP